MLTNQETNLESELILDRTQVESLIHLNQQLLECDTFWRLYFDGVYSREGIGVGVLLVSPEGNFGKGLEGKPRALGLTINLKKPEKIDAKGQKGGTGGLEEKIGATSPIRLRMGGFLKFITVWEIFLVLSIPIFHIVWEKNLLIYHSTPSHQKISTSCFVADSSQGGGVYH